MSFTLDTVAPAAPSELGSVAALLRTEHARLERLCADLLRSYQARDWTEVRAQWAIFEPALRRHMQFEEERVLPGFRTVDGAEADALVAEHVALRLFLETIGGGIEREVPRVAYAEELLRRLRAHGAREERILYPWIDVTAAPAR